jgi:hypothetical protein
MTVKSSTLTDREKKPTMENSEFVINLHNIYLCECVIICLVSVTK